MRSRPESQNSDYYPIETAEIIDSDKESEERKSPSK